MKARNILTDISYRRLNKNDYTNISFVVDWILFIVQNLNAFSLERKFNSQTVQHYVDMLWKRSMSRSLYKIICREENFMPLNQLDVTYQKANKIVSGYISHEKNTVELDQYFKEYQLI